MSWTRSTFCGNGACVEVCRQGQIVLVRDSTGTVQAWSAREWESLLRLIKWEWTPDGVFLFADGCVEVGLGLDRHDDKLSFTASEWDAFKKGVVAEQFEIDKLREFKELSTVGPVTGQTSSRMGARRGHDPTSSITASRDLPEDQANHAAAGADITGRDTPAPAAAHMRCPTCDSPEPRLHPAVQFEGEVILCADLWHQPSDVPAGSVGSPSAGQPGLTNLQRVQKVVLTQIRLGGLKSEIAEAIVADLQEGGLIIDDPAVETQETGS